MSNDSTKIPSSDTGASDSLGIIFNEPGKSEQTKPSSENIPVSQSQSTPIPHTNKSVKSFEVDSLEAGTIVSDRRKDRATLSQNLKSAFTEWWTGTKNSLDQGFETALELTSSKASVETAIPKAETRVETIKEAAVYTSQVPKDDHSHVREKISSELKEELPQKNEPIHIKEASTQPKESAWTHIVPEQKIEAPLKESTPLQTEKEISEVPIPVSQTTVAIDKKSDTVSQMSEPTHIPLPVVPRVATVPVKPPSREPKVVHIPTTPTPIKELTPSKAFEFPGTAMPLPTKQNLDLMQNLPPFTLQETNVSQNNTVRRMMKWILLFCIVLIGAGLAFIASTRFNVFEESVSTPEVETFVIIPKIFETDTQTALALTLDKASFLTELNSKIQGAPTGISQFYPVVENSNERHSATTEEILGLLDTHLPHTTIRSLADVMVVGSVSTFKNEPFVVLQSSRFDILFSGLLTWEKYIQSDMSPLFGEIISSENFKDATLANMSVRILKDSQGNEILLYAFVDQSTVVITTSRTALTKIFEHF